MFKVVLFDLDGTLINTQEGIIESVLYTIGTLGLPKVAEEEYSSFIGPPIQQSLQRHYGMTQEEADKGAMIFRKYYQEKALFKAKPYSGILPLLEQLKDRDVKIGVATYKPEHYAISILQHFGIAPLCQVIHGSDNAGKLTKADIVRMCIDEFAIDKGDVVLVGDTDHDAKGAQEQDIAFIRVTWGFGNKKGSSPTDYPYFKMVNNTAELFSAIVI